MIDAHRWKNHTPAWLPTPALVAGVELAGPIAPLQLDSRQRAARLLVRVHGCPIGYADIVAGPAEIIDRDRILAALDPATATRLRDHLGADLQAQGVSALPRDADLAAILERAVGLACTHNASPTDGPLVTVAICTRDRTHCLGATLDSLLAQTYCPFEILVVDNAPRSDATERLVRTHYPHVRYVREPLPGLDWARNRAIVEAHGEIIAYIDDDAVADARWLQALVAGFDSPEVMCVTGLVAPLRLETAAQELFERFGYSKGFYRLAFTIKAPPPHAGFPYKGFLGTGCNSAFRRAVFDQVGLFDTRLDVGTPVPGAGDLDMFARIMRAGYTLRYEPDAIVFHDHIDDMPTLIAKMAQYQQASIAYFTKYILIDRDRALELMAHVGWSYLRKTIRGLGAAILRRDRPLALVLRQALAAWLGPLALYRSYHQIQSRGYAHSQSPINAGPSASL